MRDPFPYRMESVPDPRNVRRSLETVTGPTIALSDVANIVGGDRSPERMEHLTKALNAAHEEGRKDAQRRMRKALGLTVNFLGDVRSEFT